MPVDASIVFAPRFTTLVGAKAVTTLALDVSGFTGAQFQVWRGPIRVSTPGSEQFSIEFEESLDTETWVLGPSTPQSFVISENQVHFFSYNFRLRWFRLKMTLAGTGPMVSMWAEGLLRGGGGGAWPTQGASGPARRPAPRPISAWRTSRSSRRRSRSSAASERAGFPACSAANSRTRDEVNMERSSEPPIDRIVLLPRYSALVGATTFKLAPI